MSNTIRIRTTPNGSDKYVKVNNQYFTEKEVQNPKVFSGMVLFDVALGFPQDPHRVFSPP